MLPGHRHVPMPVLLTWHSSRSRRWISLTANKHRHLFSCRGDTERNPFTPSVFIILKQNYNIIRIIIHLGLSPVQYNNRQKFQILLLETLWCKVYIYIYKYIHIRNVLSPSLVSRWSHNCQFYIGTLQVAPLHERRFGRTRNLIKRCNLKTFAMATRSIF